MRLCRNLPVICLGLAVACLSITANPAMASEESDFPPEQIEFFEKEIRPLLIERCHKCHSSDKQKGSLRLDSRDALLTGGDTGPAIVPRQPDESELVRAVRYGDDGYQMPPDGKLPQDDIERLTKWVAMGAPWPANETSTNDTGGPQDFDFEERAKHWSFQPLQRPEIPTVQDTEWCRTPIDRFLLAKLEAQGITPATATDHSTWLRRVSFDVIGLPPTTVELAAFLNDNSPRAYETVIDRLLSSPHFGERWGRHWLDLVRYAESRGHEFDYDVANPWHYRDYVIRALNDDVPYDQYVVEHVAGDLLTSSLQAHGQCPVGPQRALRLNPQTGGNESILATGFWFLGEWVHSPVDIRQDEADRFENMIDVYSKTFLGLTVACARCHDHKFDPITQKDFYALQGYLQSTSYRQVRFETMEYNRRVAAELEQLRREAAKQIMPVIAELVEPVVDDLDEYLIAARDLIQSGVETHPMQEDIVFADFESGTYDGWKLEGDAFGLQPQTLDTIADYQGQINAQGTYFVNSHQRRDGGRGDEHLGVMTSKPFVIDRSFIHLQVGGGNHEWRTCVLLLVDDEIPYSATGRNDNQMHDVTWDVRPYRDRTARIRIIDNEKGGWGNIGVDHIVFSDQHPAGVLQFTRDDFTKEFLVKIEDKAHTLLLDPTILQHWIAHLLNAQDDESDPFYLWAGFATGLLPDVAAVRKECDKLVEKLWPSVDFLDVPNELGDHIFGSYNLIASSPSFRNPGQSMADVRFSNAPEAPIETVVAFPYYIELDETWSESTDASGTMHESGATQSWQLGVSVRTPTFELKSGKLDCLIRGGVNTYIAVDSHLLINGPLHATLVHEHPAPNDAGWRWIELDASRYKGHRAHIEFVPHTSEEFAIANIIQIAEEISDTLPIDRHVQFYPHLDLSHDEMESARSLARLYQQEFLSIEICCDWFFAPGGKSGTCSLAETEWAIRHPHLFGLDDEESRLQLKWASEEYFKEVEQIRKDRRLVSALAPAMLDGSGEDEYVFIRGNWKKRGDVVPRRFLEVFNGTKMRRPKSGSGRLALAQWMVEPEKTPILPRVIVNRIWQHYFGTGLVPTPDDFGHMGRPPSHPELLDWLATELVRSGWSLKHIHRLILTSSAYRMSSEANSDGDSQLSTLHAQLLPRMPVKRLEGEVIRDAILSLSGRLDDRMYDRSVPVHLTPFMEGRGRPKKSGPVDGAGRRSLYIAVRRNFADPFFQAFDMPNPHSTIGLRTVSNVPAQALAMMNNPMVVKQSRLWAQRLLTDQKTRTMEARIQQAYLACVSREPSEIEIAAAKEFVETQAQELNVAQDAPQVWADLCHVLLNAKEFLFVR